MTIFKMDGDPLSVFNWVKTQKAIKELQELLLCLICKQQPKDPMGMGTCDHFFCASCISNQPSNSCPLCGIPSTPVQHQPDPIVSGLVTTASDILTLINGGTISSLNPGLEAPAGSDKSHTYEFKKPMPLSNNQAQCNSLKPDKDLETPKPKKQKLNMPASKKTTKNEPSACNSKSSPLQSNTPASKKIDNVQEENTDLKLPSTSKDTPTSKKATGLQKKCTDLKLASTSTTKKPISAQKENIDLKLPSTSNGTQASKKVYGVQKDSTDSKVSSMSMSKVSITPPLNVHCKRNAKGETLLHSSCIKGNVEKIKELLDDGADPNTKDNAGWTPLHEACSNGFKQIAELLLTYGALVDPPGNKNTTPLHDAVINCLPDMIIFLRKWGACDQVRDIWGRNARCLADLAPVSEKLHSALDTLADNTFKPSLKKPINVYSKFVFTPCDLNAKSKKDLDCLAKQMKAKVVAEFSPDVTHIVVGCIPGTKYSQRSLKYMMGVASGKFIISSLWVDKCLLNGDYSEPDEFEVTGSSVHPSSNAPAKGRQNVAFLKPGLFSGLHIYFQGSFSNELGTKKDLELLIKYGDGIPLQREPNPESISLPDETVPYYASCDSPLAKCSHLCIYQEGPTEPLLKYDMPHIKSLPLAWLLDCIDNCALVEPFK